MRLHSGAAYGVNRRVRPVDSIGPESAPPTPRLHLAFLIDGPPQVHPPASDLYDHLIQMPAARRPNPASTKVRRDQWAASRLTSIARLAINSSTSRLLSVKRKYSAPPAR